MNINEVHWNFSDNGTKEPAKSRFWNFYNFWTAWNFLMRFSLLCSGEWALSFYLCVFIYTGVSLTPRISLSIRPYFFFFFFLYFPIVSYGKYGKILKASNSEVNSPNWLKFEHIWDFIPFLNFCKFHEVPIKNEWDKPRTAISVMDTTHRDDTTIPYLKPYKIRIQE